MKLEDFGILETKIKGLIKEVTDLRRENQRLILKLEEMDKRKTITQEMEESIKGKVKNLIQIIDSIQSENEK